MKKKTLVSSILAIVLCLGLIAGTTYALFTSEDNVNIAVNSGKVSVTATVTDLVTYSMGEVTANNGTFANGGTAAFDQAAKKLTLENVTPGDKVTFTIELTNASTVDIQYRLIWNISGELTEALEINASNLDWTQWATSEEATKEIGVTVELPADFETQGLEDAAITFTVEAVQANAIVEEVATADQLWTALEMGVDYITLKQNITLAEGQVLTVKEGATATINLNGKTVLGGNNTASSHAEGHMIVNNGTLHIVGDENSVISSNSVKNGYGVILNNGDLTLEGGLYTGSEWGGTKDDYPGYTIRNCGNMTVKETTKVHGTFGCIANPGGNLTIEGGVYTNTDLPGFTKYLVSVWNSGKIIIKDGEFNWTSSDANAMGTPIVGAWNDGSIEIYGGTFDADQGAMGYNNAAVTIYGGTFKNAARNVFGNSNGIATLVAEYYAVYDNDGVWTVDYAETVATPSTNEDLQAAISGGKETVLVQAGTYTFPSGVNSDSVTIICEEGTVFEGNTKLNIGGATVVGATFSNPSGTAVDQTINGTFKNCTFTGSNGLRWCYAGETVVFENCVFDGSLYGVHFDGGANDVAFKDCTFSGFNALGGAIEKVTMEGCTFKANGKSGYNGINLWGNTEMKNCTFVFDGSTTEWVDACGNNKTYTFTDCVVVDGEGNEKSVGEYVGDYGNGNTITIDGQTYVGSNESLKASAAANTTLYLIGNTETVYDLNGIQADGLTLIGVGNDVKVVNNTKYASGKATGAIWQAINLQNVTITNTVYTMADGGDATFTNVNFAAGVRQAYGKNVQFTDCTFGSNSEGYALHFQTDSASEGGNIQLTGCDFEGGKVHLGGKRAYTFTGCDFAAGTDFQVWSNITLDNCTVDGVVVTAENIATLFPNLNLEKVTLN